MKTVVMEVSGKHAVLLNTGGEFLKVRNKNYILGQRLDISARPVRFSKLAVTAAASAAILLGSSAYAYCAPYTQVSMDVNPSIELTLNYFNRVIGAVAVNDDGQQILNNLHLFSDDLSTATEEIVGELSAQGYLQPDAEGNVMITAASRDEARSAELVETSMEAVENEAEEQELDVSVYGEPVNNEVLVQAREYGVSPGKLRLVEEYAKSTGDPASVNLEDWLNQPVKNIIRATKENGGMPPGAAVGYGKGNGNGQDKKDKKGDASPTPTQTVTGTPSSTPGDTSSPTDTSTITPTASTAPSSVPSAAAAGTGVKEQNGNNNGKGQDKKDNTPSPSPSPAPTASQPDKGNSGNNGNGNGNGNKQGR